MKKTFFILTILCCSTFFACKKINKNVTVVRDCTGTYLNLNEKDYHVCNPEKIESFPSGAVVEVTFKKIKKCSGSAKDTFVCQMYHENEGWIEIENVK